MCISSVCAATLNETNDHKTLNTPVLDDSIASARDDSGGVISKNNDSNKLSHEGSNNNVLNDGESSEYTIKGLEKLIKYTPDYLTIENDYTYNSLIDGSNGLEIVKSNYVIDFNGHTLNANGYSGTFLKISGNNVVIKNLKYINGKGTSNDFSIKWLGNKGTLDNVALINSPNTIYWDGSDGTLNKANFTKITNQKALYASGNAVNLKFTNSEVSEISCKNADITVFEFTKSAYISNINFYKISQTTSYTEWNVAFFVVGENSVMTDCTFRDSSYCILVYLQTNAVLSNTLFEKCTSRNWRGILLSASNSLGTVADNCTFRRCIGTAASRPGTDEYSRIIWINNPLTTISNCVFDNNAATTIISLSGSQVSDCIFKNNRARCIQTYRIDGS